MARLTARSLLLVAVPWAIVFGCALAVTGCGDSDSGGSGSGGLSGTGGSGGGTANICDTLCGNCGDATESCEAQCDGIVGNPDGADLSVCSDEIDAVSTCIEDSGCDSLIFNCLEEFSAWAQCVVDTSRL